MCGTRLPMPHWPSNRNVGIHGNGGQVPTPGSQRSYSAGTRLPMPETALSLRAGISGNGGQAHGNLPAIVTHAGIEPAPCTWRWQAGGGQV